MKWAGIVVLLVTVAVLETFLGGPWLGGHVTIDLSTAAVVYVALLGGRRAGAVAGFLAGLLADLAGPGALGRSSLVLAALGFLVGVGGARTVRESGLAQFVFLVLAMCVRQVVSFLTSSAGDWGAGAGLFFGYVLPSALVSAGLALWLFRLVSRLAGWTLRTGGFRVR